MRLIPMSCACATLASQYKALAESTARRANEERAAAAVADLERMRATEAERRTLEVGWECVRVCTARAR